MSSLREPAMAAVKASLAAMYPARLVLRGLQDPAVLGDAALTQGVFCIVAEGTRDWSDIAGREGEFGTVDFAVVGYCRVGDEDSTEQLEQQEAVLEAELLTWCGAIKPAPIDAVYPKAATYSRGFDAPMGWIVMGMEAEYV